MEGLSGFTSLIISIEDTSVTTSLEVINGMAIRVQVSSFSIGRSPFGIVADRADDFLFPAKTRMKVVVTQTLPSFAEVSPHHFQFQFQLF